ncbi:DgyrCDS4098 [Dimorphilus gyrociliatus]|nr:DgyrCDS4098 [Dimorphilus gyrociliatus]
MDKNINGRRIVERLEVVIPSQRTCEVKSYAERENIKYHVWPVSNEVLEKFDLGVLASFGHMIPKKVLTTLPRGIINIHPSLLPNLRGPAPIPHTILRGDRITGVTIIQLLPPSNGVDTGPILSQKKFQVDENAFTLDLMKLLAKNGSKMLLEVLKEYKKSTAENQATEISSDYYAFKFKTLHSYINWNHLAENIYKQYKALGYSMELRSSFKGNRVRLHEMHKPDYRIPSLFKSEGKLSNRLNVLGSESNQDSFNQIKNGRVFYSKEKNSLAIKCSDSFIYFNKITLHKRMSALDFYNGYLTKTKEFVLEVKDNELDKCFLIRD